MGREPYRSVEPPTKRARPDILAHPYAPTGGTGVVTDDAASRWAASATRLGRWQGSPRRGA